eukprot:COSAG02_NODE_4136_length_5728_cov_5.776692_3_plen_446_part_00
MPGLLGHRETRLAGADDPLADTSTCTCGGGGDGGMMMTQMIMVSRSSAYMLDLPSSVLQHILLTATTHEDLVLHVSRCARVCRPWRAIALRSPAYMLGALETSSEQLDEFAASHPAAGDSQATSSRTAYSPSPAQNDQVSLSWEPMQDQQVLWSWEPMSFVNGDEDSVSCDCADNSLEVGSSAALGSSCYNMRGRLLRGLSEGLRRRTTMPIPKRWGDDLPYELVEALLLHADESDDAFCAAGRRPAFLCELGDDMLGSIFVETHGSQRRRIGTDVWSLQGGPQAMEHMHQVGGDVGLLGETSASSAILSSRPRSRLEQADTLCVEKIHGMVSLRHPTRNHFMLYRNFHMYRLAEIAGSTTGKRLRSCGRRVYHLSTALNLSIYGPSAVASVGSPGTTVSDSPKLLDLSWHGSQRMFTSECMDSVTYLGPPVAGALGATLQVNSS